jgi:hypothetical protein
MKNLSVEKLLKEEGYNLESLSFESQEDNCIELKAKGLLSYISVYTDISEAVWHIWKNAGEGVEYKESEPCIGCVCELQQGFYTRYDKYYFSGKW